MTSPITVTERDHGCVEAAQSTKNQEHVGVCRGIIYGHWYVGYANTTLCTNCDIDLVISSTFATVVSWGFDKYPVDRSRSVKIKSDERDFGSVFRLFVYGE